MTKRSSPAYVAIDWSGRKAGSGRTIWLAVMRDGRIQRLENGWSRKAIEAELIHLAGEHDELFVGLDFAFGFPQWFTTAKGWRTGQDAWAAAALDGERWLEEEQPPFWGRKHKSPTSGGAPLRETDESVAGTPKSVFQIGGAGAVGTGSIRGMPILECLAADGFAVWPFDTPAPGQPTVVEIYPRLLTGPVKKSLVRGCLERLERYDDYELPPFLRGMAAATEDSFDAAVSALEMAKHARQLTELPSVPAVGRTEGWIGAQPATSKASEASSAQIAMSATRTYVGPTSNSLRASPLVSGPCDI